MGDAKRIELRPISAKDSNRIIRELHYSGKVTNNSQVHFGVFMDGRCGGAMQFGPPMDRRKLLPLVGGTKWHEMIELNRMAFADWIPRNSESRSLGVALRTMRKQYPHLKWVVSFADATECGDGTIYRAAGFVLTSIKKNSTILELPDGSRVASLTVTNLARWKTRAEIEKKTGVKLGANGSAGTKALIDYGAKRAAGFQLRYIFFLDPSSRARLTVPEIPFSKIAELGAGMYRGKPRAVSIVADAPAIHAGEGGSVPTTALQSKLTGGKAVRG